VGREFKNRGWHIITTPKDVFEAGKLKEDFMTVEKEGFWVTLPPAQFMRMLMELLRELVMKAAPQASGNEFNLPVYEHEATIWD